jgi:membrane-associated phospholipid phosphatase
MIPWTYLTAIGDSNFTLPAAAAIAVWLATGRAWRMAFWWCLLFGATLSIVAASKIAFIGWGVGIESIDFTGFSGHAMRAAAVYPVMCYVIFMRAFPVIRNCAVAFGIVAGLLISISRVVLHYHSVSEAVAGAVLGLATALIFIWLTTRLPKPRLNRPFIALSLVALSFPSFAQPAPTKQWTEGVALYLSGRDAPFTREEWEHKRKH